MSDLFGQEMNQEAEDILGALDSPVLAREVRAMKEADAVERIKDEVLGFFHNRIAAISRAEEIKELVYQQLTNDISNGDLNFEQKMTVLMRLARDNNDSADSIISMFRPSGNGQGSLLTDIVRTETDKSELARAIENYSPEELRKINETFKVIRDIVETGGTVSVETQNDKIPVAEL
jgi:mRNA-degrading endonuclease toxin of MazEF toxin-antitoxin module